MKKYVKPEILCEELAPETICSACLIQNPTLNEFEQCSYEPEGLGFALFADSWASCEISNGFFNYCYHVSVTNLFGS